MWITSILSWGSRILPFIKNIPYLKWIGIGGAVIGLAYGAYQVYDFKNEYEDLKRNKIVLEEKIKSREEEITRQTEIANNNAKLLERERKRAQEVVDILENKHKRELARMEELLKIEEKTYNEKDGNTAPVLRNTINRLFSEETGTRD